MFHVYRIRDYLDIKEEIHKDYLILNHSYDECKLFCQLYTKRIFFTKSKKNTWDKLKISFQIHDIQTIDKCLLNKYNYTFLYDDSHIAFYQDELYIFNEQDSTHEKYINLQEFIGFKNQDYNPGFTI